MVRKFSGIIFLLFVLGGCAVGHQYDYVADTAPLAADSDKTVTASVIDFRSYVISGEKGPNFVGLQRGGFGNPFDVTTKSGQPLAADMTAGVVRSLAAQGIDVQPLALPPGTGLDAAMAAFQSQNSERLLLLRMLEWKTDAVMRFRVMWNLSAEVYDRTGQLLAQDDIQGDRAVGGAGFESGNSSMAVQELSRQLADLLNDPEIVAALR